ncbi:CPBP family intramembrane glutamic endopeptidase [Candidatus Chlorohelix sp.]|uniref:CPBP family intramembrane glutamic endopeptidase n=1 Tax=Candidatus Chlorohelix sp. TaxID=3139201 RepID=UPI0030482C9A
MNFLVVLVVALLVSAGWFISLRFLGLKSEIQKRDPASAEQRLGWIRTFRDLAFFFSLYFIITTLLIFSFAFIYALINPPNKFNYLDSFGQIVNSVSQDGGVLSVSSIWGALVLLVGSVTAVFVSQRVARGHFILDLGLRLYTAVPVDIILGILLGPLLFALVYFFERSTGFMLSNTGPNYDAGQILQWVAIFLCVAIAEELVVRGYILQAINLTWGGVAAVVASSVFWGLSHLLNPHGSILAAVNIALAGLVFAYAYMITGRLWLPIAFNFSWNFAQGVIFGFPVSGFTVSSPVLQPLVDGPDSVTGGSFGPEGGLVGMVALLAAALLLYGWSKTRQFPKN